MEFHFFWCKFSIERFKRHDRRSWQQVNKNTLIYSLQHFPYVTFTPSKCTNWFQIQEPKTSLVHFKEKRVFLPMLIVIGLLLLQQFSGINIVIFYAKTIFLRAGFEDSPNLPQNLVGQFYIFLSTFKLDFCSCPFASMTQFLNNLVFRYR